MALVKCMECNKEVSDMAISCPNCGCPIRKLVVEERKCNIDVQQKKQGSYKGNFSKMRKAFGITNLVLGTIFFLMILSSDGGIENNSRMSGTSWLLIWTGALGMIGAKKKGFSIASIVFYAISIIYNLRCMVEYPAHSIIAVMLIVFLILVSISLSDSESFMKSNK